MNNELKGAKSIQTVLTIGLVFQIVYLVLMWIANIFQSSYMFMFTDIELEPVMDMPMLLASTITSILYFIIFTVFYSKVQRSSRATVGLGIAVGIYDVLFYLIIPHIVVFISNSMAAMKGERTLLTVACVRNAESMIDILFAVAVGLLLCAYAMYWYAVKYMQQDNQNNWAM